jgi:hypothetical protein
MPIETPEMRKLRLALEGTLRDQDDTILSMQARIEVLQAELEAERERKAFWKHECESADAALADLRRQGRRPAA